MPEEAMSFTERKRAELSAERTTREAETRRVDDPPQRAPIAEAESADEQQDVSSEELLADDETLEEEEAESGDPESGAPTEEADESEEDTTDWKKRFEDTELKLREVTENRSQIEKDLAEQESEGRRAESCLHVANDDRQCTAIPEHQLGAGSAREGSGTAKPGSTGVHAGATGSAGVREHQTRA